VRAAALFVLLAALAPAPAARADDLIFFGSAGIRVTRQATAPVTTTGSISLEFHGDPAAGCAQRGLCDVTGSVTWRPEPRGSLSAYRLHTPKGPAIFVSASLVGGEDLGGSPATTATTQRSAAGAACADVVSERYNPLSGQANGGVALIGAGRSGFGIAPSDIFATRCPGPLMADVARLLPSAAVRFGDVATGRRTIDLAGERTFSAGGFAGTVRSTLALRVGPGTASRGSGQQSSIPGRRVRRRELTAEYEARLTGSAAVELAGAGDEARCAPLDACGIAGTVTIASPPGTGDAYVTVDAPARLSASALRASAGLAPGPPPAGARVFGVATTGRRLTAAAVLTRDGAPGCSDRVPTTGASLILAYTGTRVTASLTGNDADLLHTHCGGPTTGDLVGQGFLARGSVPLAAMRAPSVTIPLTQGRSFDAGAWHGTVRPSLRLVLRRKKVRVRIYREPAAFTRPAGP
jgi:hypothetical protein